jgi:uncharacterized protein YraI
MKFRPLIAAALGMGLALAVPAVAQAYSAHTTGGVNQRTGPGTGYPVVGTLGAGTPVNVTGCQPGWCSVSSYLGWGWVSSSYLSGGGRAYAPPYYPRVYPRVYPRPPIYPYPYRYPYYRYPRPAPGLNFYFGWR